MKSIVDRLEDLRLASHKVEEVDRLIAEQEWKIKQSKFDYQLSFLSYIDMVTTGLVMMVLCYCCCCKCCKRRFPGFSKWWKDNNPCTTITIKPKIINSLHSFRESLRTSNTRSINARKPSQGDVIEETELVLLKTGIKQITPSGKRKGTISVPCIKKTLSTKRLCNSVYIIVYYIKAMLYTLL